MRKRTRLLALTIAAACGLAGCGGGDETSPAANNKEGGKSSETYEATMMYLVANDARDVDSVEKAFNELTMEQLNMKVDLVPITMGTYFQQIQMLLSSDEPLDIVPVFSSNAGSYVASDYLEDMSPYLDNVASDITEIVGMEDISCCSIGDFIWGVPNMHERTNPICYVLRTDLLGESGFKAEDIKTSSDLTAVYEKVKEKHPDMIMYGGANSTLEGANTTIFDSLGGDNLGVLMNNGQDTKVSNWYESDEFLALAELLYEWNEKGFVSKDLATSTDSGSAMMRAGNLFSYTIFGKPNSKQETDALTGCDTTVIQVTPDVCYTATTSGIAYSITANSRNPEKAAELMNWVYKTEAANDLLNWGIEGKDYVINEEGTLEYPENVNADNVGYHQDMGWGQLNQYNSHVWTGNDADIWDRYKEVRENAILSKAYGFTFDTAPVVNEIVALNAVKEEHVMSIVAGAVEPKAAIQKLNEALYNAGLQTVMDEKQRQFDAWLAEQ